LGNFRAGAAVGRRAASGRVHVSLLRSEIVSTLDDVKGVPLVEHEVEEFAGLERRVRLVGALHTADVFLSVSRPPARFNARLQLRNHIASWGRTTHGKRGRV